MTSKEITLERAYRYEERLGILCGTARPTREQIEIARAEAEAWADRQVDEETISALSQSKPVSC